MTKRMEWYVGDSPPLRIEVLDPDTDAALVLSRPPVVEIVHPDRTRTEPSVEEGDEAYDVTFDLDAEGAWAVIVIPPEPYNKIGVLNLYANPLPGEA